MARYGARPIRVVFAPIALLPWLTREHTRWSRRSARLRRSAPSTSRLWRVPAFVLSVLSWLVLAVSNWFVLVAFDLGLGYSAGVLILVTTTLSLVIPSAPGGLGVFEAGGVDRAPRLRRRRLHGAFRHGRPARAQRLPVRRRGLRRAAPPRLPAAGGRGRALLIPPEQSFTTMPPHMSEKQRALITGITGQDGSYLADALLEKDYEVYGMVRRASTENFERIEHLVGRVHLIQGDLLDQASLVSVLEESQPQEVYNLAAQSFVPTSWNQPVLTAEFTAVGVTRMLEAVRRVDPDDPLLPGLLIGDVREGARGAAKRADAVLPALAVRGRQGLRALHHSQLPRVVRPVRGLGNPLQPRVEPPGPRVRDAERSATGSHGSSSVKPTSFGSATSTPGATGASPATTSKRCG